MGWTDLPIGAVDAERWVTRTGCGTVLLLADTLTSGQRLLPVAEELGRDPRLDAAARPTNHPGYFAGSLLVVLYRTLGMAPTDSPELLSAPVTLADHQRGEAR